MFKIKTFIKLIFVFALIVSGKSFADDNQDKTIYFFKKDTCPYCRMAMDYIKKELPNIKMNIVDVNDSDGAKLLLKKADFYNVSRNDIGIPFIAVGKNYMIGWGADNGELLKQYIKELNKTK